MVKWWMDDAETPLSAEFTEVLLKTPSEFVSFERIYAKGEVDPTAIYDKRTGNRCSRKLCKMSLSTGVMVHEIFAPAIMTQVCDKYAEFKANPKLHIFIPGRVLNLRYCAGCTPDGVLIEDSERFTELICRENGSDVAGTPRAIFEIKTSCSVESRVTATEMTAAQTSAASAADAFVAALSRGKTKWITMGGTAKPRETTRFFTRKRPIPAQLNTWITRFDAAGAPTDTDFIDDRRLRVNTNTAAVRQLAEQTMSLQRWTTTAKSLLVTVALTPRGRPAVAVTTELNLTAQVSDLKEAAAKFLRIIGFEV